MSFAKELVVKAPAKINLGLEVLGPRPDGYHELATIFVAIDICDTLRIQETADPLISCDVSHVPLGENLIERALAAVRNAAKAGTGAITRVEKRIPIASGLGGASSDAASALLAGRAMWNPGLEDGTMLDLAASLGSDVPFFLQGGAALGTGRGEALAPLPFPSDLSFVVVVPHITLPRKTATLFARLQPQDFSDGNRVREQAARIAAGLPLERVLLANAFARALYESLPDLAELPARMHAAGAPTIAISGAGPAHYALVDDFETAQRIASDLRTSLGDAARVFVAQPLPPRYHACGHVHQRDVNEN